MPLGSSLVFRVQARIKNLVTQAVKNDIIDSDTSLFLITEYPITRVIYVLLKIHKDPANPPGHLIVSGMESVTTMLAKYLDKVLTPLVL